MKISKVDHKHTAVALKEKDIEGFLYQNPGQLEDTTGNRIDKLISKAASLYNVVDKSKINGLATKKDIEKKESINKIYCQFDKNIKKYFYSESNLDTTQEHLINLPECSVVNNLTEPKAKELISQIVDLGLKKKFKKEVKIKDQTCYIPDIVKELMYDVCFRETLNGVIDDNKKDRYYYLAKFIIEDKSKNKQKELIKKSIINQKVKVKVENINGKNRIVPASYNTKKNQYLYKFLKEYAELDKEKREEKLVEIRKLIVLFVCGEDNYNLIKDEKLNAFKFDGYKIDEKKMFLSDRIRDLKNEDYELKPQVDKEKAIMQKLLNDNRLDRVGVQIRKDLIDHYRNAKKVLNGDEESLYWISYFQSSLETLFKKTNKRSLERLHCKYLCEYLWKDFFPYIASKYVELGKGVYQFAMPDLFNTDITSGIELGVVENQRFVDGITSFDYERISAKETLERNIATSATFASSAFSRCVVKDEVREQDKQEDVLDREIKEENEKPDALKNIMQYFGGASNWSDVLDTIKDENKFFNDLRKSIYSIRNGSFHYTSKQEKSKIADDSFIRVIFENEYSKLKDVYAKKYYSNNIPNFYNKNDIYKLMEELYDKEANRAAQVPSFNKIIIKNGNPEKEKNLATVINKLINEDNLKELKKDNEKFEQFRSALIYILKEIYYYDFLQEKNLKELFVEKIKSWKATDNDKNLESQKTFIARINEIENYGDFAYICQTIMTDYNMQNQDKIINTTKKTKQLAKNGIKKKYQNYPELLQKAIREMFVDYLLADKKQVYGFLNKPDLVYAENNQSVEIFIENAPHPKTFTSLKDRISNESKLLDWYILSRFLPAKQLNLLIGDFRNYIQYVTNIDERAKNVANKIDDNKDEAIKYYNDVIKVLEFSLIFTGQISDNILDYFEDKNAYAKYLSEFIDFKGKTFNDLRKFDKNNIYSDEAHGILNKNIAYSIMFGNSKLMAKCVKKIKEKDITEFYKLGNELMTVFGKKKCETIEEQQKLRKYQNIKNRIELYDIETFTNIINDYLSQLVSWMYMRERDLMYFQLGVHYLRLFFSDVNLDEKYHSLKSELVDIKDGALLYQIVSMYSYELTMFTIKNGEVVKEKDTQGLGSIRGFYKKYADEETYEWGLELFEDTNRHEEFIEFRNSIAHMHYLIRQDSSIMELLSNVYNGFFIYDRNLQKSVSFVFKNILMKHHIKANTTMKHKDDNNSSFGMFIKDDEIDDYEPNNNKYGLVSDEFTYKKLKDENGEEKNEATIEAYDRTFINQVKKILEYKEKNK